MDIEKKYLGEDYTSYGVDIPGYKQTHPKICQSCVNAKKGKGTFVYLECKAFDDIEVHNYGTCPKYREVLG